MIECCGSIPLFVEVFPAELFQQVLMEKDVRKPLPLI